MGKLATSIRTTLRRRGLSVEELGEEIGLARSTMFELLKEDADPRLSTLRKLHAGGVPIPRSVLQG